MKTKEQVLDEYFPKGNKKRGEAMACIVVAYLEGRKQAFEEVEKMIEDLNENFRKENMPQRLSGDEFNDLWQEELKAQIERKLEKK